MEEPKYKFRTKNIYEPVLFARVDFCVGDKEDMLAWLKKNKMGDGPERFWDLQGFFTRFEDKEGNRIRRVVWIGRASNFYALYHEVVHLVKDIFVQNGIPFVAENEEMIAYYQTHWFRQMWHWMGLWNEEDLKLKNSAAEVKDGGGLLPMPGNG